MKIHVRHEIAAVAVPVPQWRDLAYRTDCLEIRDVDGKPMAIATNGRALAFVPVEMGADDKPGVYPAEAFAATRQSYQEQCDPEMAFPRARHIDEAQVELHLVGDGVVRDLRQRCKPVSGGPPQTTTVASTEWRTEGSAKFPDAVALLNEWRAKPATGRVTLSVEHLVSLAKALGSTALQIDLHGRTGPLVVRPANSMGAIEQGIGLLMPIASDEDFEADEQAGGAL